MPYLAYARPRYRKHRASGQAIVEFGGQVHYPGVYGSPKSQDRYDELIKDWQSKGRPAEGIALPLVQPPTEENEPREPLIVELVDQFWAYAEERFVKYGRATGTHENYRPALRLLLERFGNSPISSFGPKSLKSLLKTWKQEGNSRRYINDNLARIRRVFAWGVSEEIVPATMVTALATVESVPKGATGVVDHPEVQAVSEEVIPTTLTCLPPVVADMVRFQLLTGCRPGEACILRPADLKLSEDVWLYTPSIHKTEHHDKNRTIVVGPRALAILAPYLKRAAHLYCFMPAESEASRNAARRKKRATPLTKSQQQRARVVEPRRSAGDYYTNDSYRRATKRACDRAFPPPQDLTKVERKQWQTAHRWSPNQLRHAAATKICLHFESLLHAKEMLGHQTIRTTENYAKPKLEFARKAMRELG